MKYRIRRCNGNKLVWGLFTLREDGSEIEVAFSYVTSYSLDALLSRAERELGLEPEDRIEMVFA